MRKSLLAIALLFSVTGATLALPTPASAAPTVAQAAREVSQERVFGSKYGHYKSTSPYSYKLNWNNNGCSSPFDNRVSNFYEGVFEKSCDRHDFGYRNHGVSGLSRLAIDDRFHANMDHQCLVRYDDAWDLPARGLCYKASDAFYLAVRVGGGSHW